MIQTLLLLVVLSSSTWSYTTRDKARMLEESGSAGSASELYLRLAMYGDYIRLKALSGNDPSQDIVRYRKHLAGDVNFYMGLYYFSTGKWKEAVDSFDKVKGQELEQAKFYTFQSFVMIAQLNNAEAVLKKLSEQIPSSLLTQAKMKSLLLYATNEQFKAMDGFKQILDKEPRDRFSRRYLGQIYYRTGWFDKAEDIYKELIDSEWRDTELFYLLSERCEMRVRYNELVLAKKDADRLIDEYKDRQDFIVHFISWLLEYGHDKVASKYLKYINDATSYNKSLRYFSEYLMAKSRGNDELAYSLISSAEKTYHSEQYSSIIDIMDRTRVQASKSYKYKGQVCKDRRFEVVPNSKVPSIKVKVLFTANGGLNFEPFKKMWLKEGNKKWSSNEINVEFVGVDITGPRVSEIRVSPWPSLYYSRRQSSHDVSILSPANIVAHEFGHLLGLVDEYYEPDPTLSKLNRGRYIGVPNSIMRNMELGVPQKMHIQFILSSLECRD